MELIKLIFSKGSYSISPNKSLLDFLELSVRPYHQFGVVTIDTSEPALEEKHQHMYGTSVASDY
jgi:hypothetical protein